VLSEADRCPVRACALQMSLAVKSGSSSVSRRRDAS